MEQTSMFSYGYKSKFKSFTQLIVLTAIFVTNPSKLMAFNHYNDPSKLPGTLETNFQIIPKSAEIKKIPWSGWSWKSYSGGIAYRWQKKIKPWNYKSPSLERLRNMSQSEIKLLSPAEKFDILRGRYEYPTVTSERNRTSPSALSWFGLCHGWAVASLRFDEPKPATMTNPDGIDVEFGSSDIKALLTFYLGEVEADPKYMIGRRCNSSDLSSSDCTDINAGAFHLALTNMVGIQKKGLVVEISKDKEIWNKPVYKYSTKVNSRTGRTITVTTSVTYGERTETSWNPVSGTPLGKTKTRVYKYRLKVDAYDNVIGGTWITSKHPDFVWVRGDEIFTSSGSQELEDLYNKSTGNIQAPGTGNNDNISDSFYCPTSYSLEEKPNGVHYCATDKTVLGPFPPLMVELCEVSFGSKCQSPTWPTKIFLGLRGEKVCPKGSEFDSVLEVCTDGIFAYGPFPTKAVLNCKSGFPSVSCESQRWNINDADSILSR
jgi:hypothetical protein